MKNPSVLDKGLPEQWKIDGRYKSYLTKGTIECGATFYFSPLTVEKEVDASCASGRFYWQKIALTT
jgi:hypothetical protein